MNGSNDAVKYFDSYDCPSVYNHTYYDQRRTLLYMENLHLDYRCAKVLSIGCGNGYVESELDNIYGFGELTLVDFSANLLDCAKNKMPHAKTICCDLRTEYESITGNYDIIISLSFAQYLTSDQLLSLNRHLIGLINKSGILAHINIPDSRRKSIYRINKGIILENKEYEKPMYDFIDDYSRWCNRSDFIIEDAKTTFVTPSLDWERFDAFLERK